MYQTLEDLEKIQNDQEISNKQKKWLKWILIALWASIILTWAWAWLTKAGVIPNWLGIELLCPWKGEYKMAYTVDPDTDGECPDWYELIYGECHEQWWPHRWWSKSAWTIWCLNCEYYDAAEECSKYYKMPKVEWYTQESYDAWVKEKHPEDPDGEKQKRKNKMENTEWKWDLLWELIDPVDLFKRSEDLSRNPYYDEWLDDEFDWYQEALKEYESYQNGCWSYTQVDKPIIYLYPTSETEVHVSLWNPRNLLHTYPKYNSEKWRNVIAQPNGDLKDMDTWRKLYALYREWKSDIETNFDEWFVVAWKDIIPFLEEKLAILWLNEREAEEFIVYRLPQMEDNEWNLIRFESKAEQDKNMPLNITPTPDTVIRVMMDWKAIDESIDIPEQELVTPERNWFVVVEWWGSSRN